MVKHKTIKAKKPITTPAVVVLQWLTYAFWALSIVAIAYVAATAIGFYTDVDTTTSAEVIAYGIVAVIILLPLAIIMDVLFGRHEDSHKSTATSVVLVIHSVLFALTTIGALITLAFLSVNLLLTSSSNPTAIVDISTAAIVFVLFGALLLRVTRPTLHAWLRPLFRIKLAAVALVVVIFAVIGPIAYTLETKSDRQARDSVIFISNTLSSYIAQGNALPDTLATGLTGQPSIYGYDDSISETALRLQSEGVITYTPNISEVSHDGDSGSGIGESTTYYYELCVTYTHTLRNDTTYAYPVAVDARGYSDYVDMTSVKPGTSCYKLKATNYK